MSTPEFIAGIFLIFTLFQINVLTCSGPCRKQGVGSTTERKKNQNKQLNSNNRLFFDETHFGKVNRKIIQKGEKKIPFSAES